MIRLPNLFGYWPSRATANYRWWIFARRTPQTERAVTRSRPVVMVHDSGVETRYLLAKCHRWCLGCCHQSFYIQGSFPHSKSTNRSCFTPTCLRRTPKPFWMRLLRYRIIRSGGPVGFQPVNFSWLDIPSGLHSTSPTCL